MKQIDPGQRELQNDEFLDALAPRAVKVIKPYTQQFPNDVWTPVSVGRAAFIRFESTTLYSIWCSPHAPPNVADDGAIKTTNNVVSLYGRGVWWVYQASGGTISGKIVDAAAGASGLETIGAPPITGAADSVLTTPLVPAAPAVGSVGTSSAELLAAAATRKQIYIKNTDTGSDKIYLGLDAAAVVGSGITLAPGESIVLGYTEARAQVRAIADAAATPCSIQTWT